MVAPGRDLSAGFLVDDRVPGLAILVAVFGFKPCRGRDGANCWGTTNERTHSPHQRISGSASRAGPARSSAARQSPCTSARASGWRWSANLGSGKSVTARIVLGLPATDAQRGGLGPRRVRRPGSGQIVGTANHAGFAARRCRMIFQDPTSSLNPVYTIGVQLPRGTCGGEIRA